MCDYRKAYYFKETQFLFYKRSTRGQKATIINYKTTKSYTLFFYFCFPVNLQL